jgi:cytochrome c-type biogenesis protein CcmH/NrfF
MTVYFLRVQDISNTRVHDNGKEKLMETIHNKTHCPLSCPGNAVEYSNLQYVNKMKCYVKYRPSSHNSNTTPT